MQDVNLKIKKNELYGLIGPNGAGKTTVFNMLTGVYKPTTGSFMLDGEDITGKSPIDINKKGIARTFQNIRLFSNMSVIDNVLVGMGNRSSCNLFESIFRLPRYWSTEKELRAGARELLRVFGLDEERRTVASNLPYGKQRKLEIARAVLLIEHDMSLVSKLCDELTVLNFGTTLAHGKVEDVLNDPEVVRAYLGE